MIYPTNIRELESSRKMPEFQSTGKIAKRDFNEFDSNRTASYFSGGKMGVQKQGQKSTFLLLKPTQTLRISKEKKLKV